MRRARNAFLALLFAFLLPVGLSSCAKDADVGGEGVEPSETEQVPADDDIGTGGQEDNLGGEATD